MNYIEKAKAALARRPKITKWKNLVFLKSGQSVLGNLEYPSKEEAEETAKEVVRAVKALDHFIECGGIKITKKELSWVMQIPIME